MVKEIKDRRTLVEMGVIDEPKGRIRFEVEEGPIKELAESIKAVGQLQPILIRPAGARYEIIYGHRRFLAHQRLGKARIWATVKKLDDVQAAIMRATENIARLDISPVEEAAVYANLIEHLGLTIDQIAKKMGKTVGIVKRRLDLLGMPPELQAAVHNKEISYGVAETLWQLKDPGAISYYLPFAIENGVTVQVCRGWVKDQKDELRRKQGDVGGGGGLLSPFENRPVYVACDTCQDPIEIGEETVLRCCPGCTAAIIKAVEES